MANFAKALASCHHVAEYERSADQQPLSSISAGAAVSARKGQEPLKACDIREGVPSPLPPSIRRHRREWFVATAESYEGNELSHLAVLDRPESERPVHLVGKEDGLVLLDSRRGGYRFMSCKPAGVRVMGSSRNATIDQIHRLISYHILDA